MPDAVPDLQNLRERKEDFYEQDQKSAVVADVSRNGGIGVLCTGHTGKCGRNICTNNAAAYSDV